MNTKLTLKLDSNIIDKAELFPTRSPLQHSYTFQSAIPFSYS
jgi:hypothetical protein